MTEFTRLLVICCVAFFGIQVGLGQSVGGESGPIDTPSGGDDTGACQPNPCHNHGVCHLNDSLSAGFICNCTRGLRGPLCEEGYCGGCSATPGLSARPCVAEEHPRRMCNITRWGWLGGHWFRGRYSRRQPQTIQVPCTFKFCCENAEPVGFRNGSCAAANLNVTADATTTRCRRPVGSSRGRVGHRGPANPNTD